MTHWWTFYASRPDSSPVFFDRAALDALSSINDLIEPIGFRFVAAYPDNMECGKGLHVDGANVLFVLPRF